MVSRWMAAAVITFWAVSAASADLLPWVPPGERDPLFRYVDPRVQFLGIDQCTDQVFFVKYLTGGGIPKIYDVTSSEPLDLSADKRIMDMKLFAVQRDVYEKNKNAPKSDWLNDQTPGVLAASMDAPNVTLLTKFNTVPVTRYWVEIGKRKGENAVSLFVSRPGAVAPGALILVVNPGSPATRVINVKDGQSWTLEAGDVITHVNNSPIKSEKAYYTALARPGKITLKVVDRKDGQTRTFEAQPQNGLLGIRYRVIAPARPGESSSLVPPWTIGLGIVLCMTAVGLGFVRRRVARPSGA